MHSLRLPVDYPEATAISFVYQQFLVYRQELALGLLRPYQYVSSSDLSESLS